MHQLPAVVGIRMPAGYVSRHHFWLRQTKTNEFISFAMWKIDLKKKICSNQVTYRGGSFMLSILFFGCASICSKICCAGCFYSNFIPWILICIVAKPFCKEWHQLWGATQHCCDALCSYLSGPHLPHHDDILSILTRTGPPLFAAEVIFYPGWHNLWGYRWT